MSVSAIMGILAGVYAIASEVVGLNPKWEENSVLQVVMTLFREVLKKG